MDFLARREHSFFELKQKLLIKYPELQLEDLDTALNALRTENLQSDERFAESYTRYRKSKGFGYHHIKSDLNSRRVPPATIEKYLFPDDADWQEIAQKLVTKKIESNQPLEYASKQHRKLVRFMESRGFAVREIHLAIETTVGFRNSI